MNQVQITIDSFGVDNAHQGPHCRRIDVYMVLLAHEYGFVEVDNHNVHGVEHADATEVGMRKDLAFDCYSLMDVHQIW